MENQNKNKIIIAILISIIIILSVLLILFATETISFKSNDIDTNKPNQNIIDDDTPENSDNNSQIDDNNNVKNNDNINNYTEQELINSVKITKFTFENPHAGSFGGGPNNTLVIDTITNLDCSNNNIVGIRLSGYCVDTNDNKYMIGGPVQVMAFYCDNDTSHVDSGHMIAGQVFDSNGNTIDTTKIKWEEVNIKYCKVDEAKFVGTDGDVLPSLSKELNFEKEFK